MLASIGKGHYDAAFDTGNVDFPLDWSTLFGTLSRIML
jgi:hypothetical protein